jgi:glycosyltransferase involved in cell wall biosynthesis
MSYLADAFVESANVELVGARISAYPDGQAIDDDLGFPVYNIPDHRFGMATLFHRQRRAFQNIVARVKPDIVHGQGANLPGLMAIESNYPSIVTVHGIIGQDAKYLSKVRDRVRERVISGLIERPVIRKARSLILISPYVRKFYGNLITGKAFNISNPVSQPYFDIKPSPQPGRLVFAGRVIPRKGLIDLIEAFAHVARIHNATLRIAGSLSDHAYVRQVKLHVRKLGLDEQVEFLGVLNDAEVIREFTTAHALVLPSYQETAPMVVLQAMAAGVPVIATNVCGVPYQVADGRSGLLFMPGDVEMLASHLRRILESPAAAHQMGLAGRRIAVESVHARAVARKTIDAYLKTLSHTEARLLNGPAQSA